MEVCTHNMTGSPQVWGPCHVSTPVGFFYLVTHTHTQCNVLWAWHCFCSSMIQKNIMTRLIITQLILKFHTWAHARKVKRNGSQFILRLAMYSYSLLQTHYTYHKPTQTIYNVNYTREPHTLWTRIVVTWAREGRKHTCSLLLLWSPDLLGRMKTEQGDLGAW